MARAYDVSEEDRDYMELETWEQTRESHVEEYEFILGRQGRGAAGAIYGFNQGCKSIWLSYYLQISTFMTGLLSFLLNTCHFLIYDTQYLLYLFWLLSISHDWYLSSCEGRDFCLALFTAVYPVLRTVGMW